jgi:hypothetical protein
VSSPTRRCGCSTRCSTTSARRTTGRSPEAEGGGGAGSRIRRPS